jgi:hypothetical protein
MTQTVSFEEVADPQVKKEFEGIELRDIQYNDYVEADQADFDNNTVIIDGEKYHLVFRAICNDIIKGLSPVICIHGTKQTGKSVLLMYLVHVLHHEIGIMAGRWRPESHLCYSVSDFFQIALNYIRECIVIDEAGELLKAEDYYSPYNRANKTGLELLGLLKHAVFYISTDHSDIDSRIRQEDKYKFTADPENVHHFNIEKIIYEKGSEKREVKERVDFGSIKAPISEIPEGLKSNYRSKEYKFKNKEGREARDIAFQKERERNMEQRF